MQASRVSHALGWAELGFDGLSPAQTLDELSLSDCRLRFSDKDLHVPDFYPCPGESELAAFHEFPNPTAAEIQDLMQQAAHPRRQCADATVPVASPSNPLLVPNLRRSHRQRHTTEVEAPVADYEDDEVIEERRRPGRPVIYRGDPDAAHLTEPERRTIKRRIANRESARRVREKKHENHEALRNEVRALDDQLRESDEQNALLKHHLKTLHAKWVTAETDKAHLQDELAALRNMQAALMQSSSSRSCAHAIKASHTLSPTLLLEGTTQATLGMPHTLPMSAW